MAESIHALCPGQPGYTNKRGSAVADGKEEREEQQSRIKQENPKTREDQYDRDYVDEWVPERVDS